MQWNTVQHIITRSLQAYVKDLLTYVTLKGHLANWSKSQVLQGFQLFASAIAQIDDPDLVIVKLPSLEAANICSNLISSKIQELVTGQYDSALIEELINADIVQPEEFVVASAQLIKASDPGYANTVFLIVRNIFEKLGLIIRHHEEAGLRLSAIPRSSEELRVNPKLTLATQEAIQEIVQDMNVIPKRYKDDSDSL